MRKRTPSEIKAYGDGYREAYEQFCHLLDKHDKDKAIRKMKIFVDAVALTVETATFTADTQQTDCETCKYGQDKHRYAHICNECGVGINNYTPQTDCSWR